MNLAKNNFVKIIGLVLIFAMIFSFANFTTPPVQAESVDDIRAEINALQSENDQLQSEIDTLDAKAKESQAYLDALLVQIDNNQESIDKCNQALVTLDAEIAAKEADIAVKNKEIAENQEMLKKRLTAIYLSDNSSKLEVLVSSDSYINFLYKEIFVQSVAEHDTELLNKIETDIESIEQQKAEILSAQSEQVELRNQLADTQSTLNEQQTEANATLATLNGQKSEKQETLAINQEETEKLDAKIAELQEAQRKAEEAAGLPPRTMAETNPDGMFAWPVPGYTSISSPFGPRNGSFHKGIDIAGGGIYGQPIVAVEAGVVIDAGPSGSGYGNYVIVDHGTKDGVNYTTVYAHMSEVLASPGDTVYRNDIIGEVGNTGRSTGPHLHYEIRQDGTAVNPQSFY